MHDLAAKLEQAERPRDEPNHLVELKAQVGTLAERLDRSDAGLTAIVAMERSLGDLFSQMGEMQSAAVRATETTARSIAQATIKDTVQANIAEAQIARAGLAATDAAVGQVSRDLTEFRATRDEADRQLQAILSALNASLERIVDRLAALESDAADEGASSQTGSASLRAEPVPGRPVDRPAGEPLDLDRPIEPSVRLPTTANGPDPATFIAAARRAAATAEQSLRTGEAADPRARVDAAPASSKWFKAGKPSKRRPLILVLASLTILAGAVQAVRVNLKGGEASLTQPAQGESIMPAPASETAEAKATAGASAASSSVTPDTAAASADVAGGGPSQASNVPPVAATASRQPAESGDQPATRVETAAPPDASVAPTKAETVAAADIAPAPAQAPLPTMAMGPKANLAAMQAADLAGKGAAGSGIPVGLRAEADAGTATAQYEVGLRYADGRGVARDLTVAAGWFDKAARQGLAPAAYRLGSVYEKGLGLPRDAAQSVSWYGKAADAGNVRAMHNLAVMLAEGATGKPDYAAASGWFTKAAEAGVRDSQYNLAILYARGMGVEQNLRQAYTWFSIAAAQGDAESAKKRDDVEARLDPDGLAEARRTVADFKPAAATPAANEVPAPAGGWDAVSTLRPTPAAATPKPTSKEHLGKL